MDEPQQHNVENDSTSEMEKKSEPEKRVATRGQQQTHSSNQAHEDKATKPSEQNPKSSLNTEDIEELDKLIFDYGRTSTKAGKCGGELESFEFKLCNLLL